MPQKKTSLIATRLLENLQLSCFLPFSGSRCGAHQSIRGIPEGANPAWRHPEATAARAASDG